MLSDQGDRNKSAQRLFCNFGIIYTLMDLYQLLKSSNKNFIPVLQLKSWTYEHRNTKV